MTQSNAAKKASPSLIILILLVSYAAVSALLFTPALPLLTEILVIPTSAAHLTVTLFLLGYGLGQLIYGPLASVYGRKKALATGLSIALMGEVISIIAVTTLSLNMLLAGRLITAIGASSGYALTFAIIRESYDLERSREIIATAILAFAIAPGIAVTIGAMLTSCYGVNASFYALFIYGLIIFALSRRLPETPMVGPIAPLKLSTIYQKYRQLFDNKAFIAYSICTALWGSFLYLYYASAPFIAITDLHVSINHYGTLTLITSAGYFIGNITARYLASKNTAQKVIHLGFRLILTGILLMACELMGLITWDILYFISVAICFVGGAMLMSNFVALGMHSITDIPSGSAMFGCISLLGPTVTVLLTNFFGKIHLDTFVITYLILFGSVLFFYRMASLQPSLTTN